MAFANWSYTIPHFLNFDEIEEVKLKYLAPWNSESSQFPAI